MDDAEAVSGLEGALAQMLKPLKGVPFATIVKSISDQTVIRIDRGSVADRALIARLETAVALCAEDLTRRPIRRSRPNEVGIDLESYVLRALPHVGLNATRPMSRTGSGKTSGYPDILLEDAAGRATYLECKMFAHGLSASGMRSFYLSPSATFKVSRDARHLLLAFGMETRRFPGSSVPAYIPRSYRLVDLHDLMCDVKYEFNSDNRRLYAPSLTLSRGIL